MAEAVIEETAGATTAGLSKTYDPRAIEAVIYDRWDGMLGEPTLWLPGADHAGIAGQWVVEREIAAKGLSRHDLGRERFLERVWENMDRLRGRTREQLRILGASCDSSRFVFTM